MIHPDVWALILKNEGGYYTRDGVSGGTYKGIAWEYNVDTLKEFGVHTFDQFKSMTDETVIRFYSHKYLPFCKADKLGNNLAYTHLDFCINKWKRANEVLQMVCNDVIGSVLKVDGIIGHKTMNAVSIMRMAMDDKFLCDLYNLKRMKYYHKKIQDKRRKQFGEINKEVVDQLQYKLDLYNSWMRRCRRLYDANA